jgi:hypothetical protein
MERDMRFLYRYADAIERHGHVNTAARIRRALWVVRGLAPPTKHRLALDRVYAVIARRAADRES